MVSKPLNKQQANLPPCLQSPPKYAKSIATLLQFWMHVANHINPLLCSGHTLGQLTTVYTNANWVVQVQEISSLSTQVVVRDRMGGLVFVWFQN